VPGAVSDRSPSPSATRATQPPPRGPASAPCPVADDSTAELMARSYANRKAVLGRAEAMRQAQLGLVAGHPEWSSPLFRIPFEVRGDWRQAHRRRPG